jgi:F-type H+-transporting ATPase subunit alpha
MLKRIEDTKQLSKDDETELVGAVQEFKKHGAF